METKIKIAVLCFDVLDVDIITVNKSFIDKNFGGDIELFLTEHCQYDPDNIEWIAGDDLNLNLNLTEKSFGGDSEEWSVSDKCIERFKNCAQFIDGKIEILNAKGEINDIVLVDENVFHDKDEYCVDMVFYDGFAVEITKDENPIILLYPTVEEVDKDLYMQRTIENYVGEAVTETGIVYHDIAVVYGEVYRFLSLLDEKINDYEKDSDNQ